MNKNQKIPDLQQALLKKQPFEVPEGYFEDFSEKLKARIREEDASKVPIRQMVTTSRFRVAMVAAVLGIALISYSIIRFASTNSGSSGSGSSGSGSSGNYPDIALLEQLQVFEDDSYLIELIESETATLDEDEAYVSQAINYLAINDVEMVLLFE